MNKLDEVKKEIAKLIDQAEKMNTHITVNSKNYDKEDREQKIKEYSASNFRSKYQTWYTKTSAIIKQLIPNRYDEFCDLYLVDKKRKEVNILTYRIQDYMNGLSSAINRSTGRKYFEDETIVQAYFQTQTGILVSALDKYDSLVFDIRKIAQAELFDSDIEEARELLENGYLRAAGAISGVLLEKHLSEIVKDHNLNVPKRNACIADYNEILKSNDIVDVVNWRFIQRLGDIRNLCDHKKEREPTNEEIDELINGVERIIKTIF